MKKRNEGLKSLAIIILVISAMYIVPHTFIGSTVLNPDQIPDIKGKWNATLFITSCDGCQDVGTFFPFDVNISQTDDKVVVKSNGPIIQSDRERLFGFEIDGTFIEGKKIFGNWSMHHADGNKINGSATLTLSEDCNSIDINSDFTAWKGRRIDGKGMVGLKFTRQDPAGCGLKCIEDFTCSAFSECTDGIQTQTCFDLKQCDKTVPSVTKTRSCAMPAPAPVPEKGSNVWIYMIIILVGLIAATGAFIFLRNKRKKPDAALELASMIEEIDSALFLGDRGKAFDQYKRFSEAFARYSGQINESDRQRMYWEGMRVYQKLSTQ